MDDVLNIVDFRGAQILQTSIIRTEVQGARRVTYTVLLTEDQQLLGTRERNIVCLENWIFAGLV